MSKSLLHTESITWLLQLLIISTLSETSVIVVNYAWDQKETGGKNYSVNLNKTVRHVKIFKPNWTSRLCFHGDELNIHIIKRHFEIHNCNMHTHYEKWSVVYICNQNRKQALQKDKHNKLATMFKSFWICVNCPVICLEYKLRICPIKNCNWNCKVLLSFALALLTALSLSLTHSNCLWRRFNLLILLRSHW